MNRGWKFSWLLAAPHRLCFFAGGSMLAAVAAWWAAALLSQGVGLGWHWQVAPPLAHGLLMAFGFMPMFFAGFLFTAGPRWLQVRGPDARLLRLPISMMGAGWAAFALGVHASALLAAFGLGMAALGWSSMVGAFAGLLRRSAAEDKTHARLIAWAGAVVAASMWLAALGLALQWLPLARAALLAALWGGLGVVFAVVSHRMIPFFTAGAVPRLDAWRPMWLLGSLVAALSVEAVLTVAGTLWWPLPPALRALQVAVEVPAAAMWLWLAWRWGLVQSLSQRLLAMLHLGFLWLGIAFALQATTHVLEGLSGGDVTLGLAPLHAFTMGFLGSTLIAMATRVACGHGGRALVADDVVWRLFWLLQAAVLARVAAAMWPAGAPALLPIAALAWATCVLAWALRYGRWFGMPRADGRPG